MKPFFLFAVTFLVTVTLSADNLLHYKVRNLSEYDFKGELLLEGHYSDGEVWIPWDTVETINVAGNTTSPVRTFQLPDRAVASAEGVRFVFRRTVIPSELVGNSYVAVGEPSEDIILDVVRHYSGTGIDGHLDEHLTDADADVFEIGPGLIHPATPDSAKGVWLVDDTTLTANLFREGIDKVVAANSGVSSSSTGGMTKEEFLTTDTEQFTKLQNQIAADNPTADDMNLAGATARTEAEAAVTQAVPTLGGTTSAPGSPGSILAFTIPYVGNINLDPGSNATVMIFCDYVKLVTGWALLVWFAWWAWAEFNSVVRATVTAQQAHGNPVLGGTGAQATALIAAGLLAAVFVGIPAAWWAYCTVDMSALDSNPFASVSGPVQTALYLVALVFPYPLALTLLGTAFVIRKAGAVMVLGVNAVVKFIVP